MKTTIAAVRRAAPFAVALALCLPRAIAGQAPAEKYPATFIRVVDSLAAGSSADNRNRALADGLSARLSQRVIVENRPGDGGNIAAMTRDQGAGWRLYAAHVIDRVSPDPEIRL